VDPLLGSLALHLLLNVMMQVLQYTTDQFDLAITMQRRLNTVLNLR
jgi:hypothetical protein